MLYSFLGTTLAGQPAEPEFVHQRLCENPAFARTCGFTIPRPGKPERQSDIPSLRKLQQFDQIMTATGLWGELALDRVAANLREGKIQVESTLVHDTTHYHAYSLMKVVDLPEAAKQPIPSHDKTTPNDKAPVVVKLDGQPVVVARVEVVRVPVHQIAQPTAAKVPPADSSLAAAATNRTAAREKTAEISGKAAAAPTSSPPAKNDKSRSQAPKKTNRKAPKATPKKQRKSHPRTTKNWRCQDRQHCAHAWVNTDVGAGTVVKSTGKMYWGHKASTLSFADQEVPLDAVAMSDAASHDSQSLLPHLSRLFDRHPDLEGLVTRVLDDGAADDAQLKASLQGQFGIELLAPINPRRRQPIRDGLPRGIDHLTPRGVPVCQAGYPFELLGFRKATEHFLFRAAGRYGSLGVPGLCAARGLLSGRVERAGGDDFGGSRALGPAVTAARLVSAGVSVIMLEWGQNRTAGRRMARRRTGRSLGKVVTMEDGYDAGRLAHEDEPAHELANQPVRNDGNGKTERAVEYPSGQETSLRTCLVKGRGGNESDGSDSERPEAEIC